MSKSKLQPIRTTGVIESTIYEDGGIRYYYVSVDYNGDTIRRIPSSYYSSKSKSLPDGKIVEVDFIETDKGYKYVDIIDEGMIPVGKDMKASLIFLGVFFFCVLLMILYFNLW